MNSGSLTITNALSHDRLIYDLLCLLAHRLITLLEENKGNQKEMTAFYNKLASLVDQIQD
jgi:hypothetical protein